MADSNVNEAFEILIDALEVAETKVHEVVIEMLRQGNYDVAKKFLKTAIQIEVFIAEQRKKGNEWKQTIGKQVTVITKPKTDEAQLELSILYTENAEKTASDSPVVNLENEATEGESNEINKDPSDFNADESDNLLQILAEASGNLDTEEPTEDNTYQQAEKISQWYQDSMPDQTRQQRGESARKSQKRLGREECTPQSEYRLPILKALVDLGGEAKSKEVLSSVYTIMKSQLKPVDYEFPPSTNVPRWKHLANWERYKIKKDGLLRKDSPRGIWAISEKGRQYLQQYAS